MQYLGIIEQRTHEILQLYAASQPQASPGPSSSPSPGPSPSPSPGPSPDPAASSAQRGVLPTAAPPLTPTYDAVPPPYSPRRRCKRATPVPTRAAAREAQGLRGWRTSWAKGRSCRPARTASRSARRARVRTTAPSRTRCRHPPHPRPAPRFTIGAAQRACGRRPRRLLRSTRMARLRTLSFGPHTAGFCGGGGGGAPA